MLLGVSDPLSAQEGVTSPGDTTVEAAQTPTDNDGDRMEVWKSGRW